MRKLFIFAAVLTGLSFSSVAFAQDSGLWLVRLRGANYSPTVTDGSGLGLSMQKKTYAEFDVSYFLSPNDAVELTLAAPQSQLAYSSVEGADVGHFKQWPVTLTGQHHFAGLQGVRPYVGAGLNYTRFSSVTLYDGAVSMQRNTFGPVLQLGLDVPVAQGWLVNVDIKKAWLKTDLSSGGSSLGGLKSDPLVISAGVGRRF